MVPEKAANGRGKPRLATGGRNGEPIVTDGPVSPTGPVELIKASRGLAIFCCMEWAIKGGADGKVTKDGTHPTAETVGAVPCGTHPTAVAVGAEPGGAHPTAVAVGAAPYGTLPMAVTIGAEPCGTHPAAETAGAVPSTADDPLTPVRVVGAIHTNVTGGKENGSVD